MVPRRGAGPLGSACFGPSLTSSGASCRPREKHGAEHEKSVPAKSPSILIDERIRELGDWRGKTLARVRELIHAADPEIVEEWKWMGTPVWSHAGIVCTGETYKTVVKLTFAKGAALQDPSRL